MIFYLQGNKSNEITGANASQSSCSRSSKSWSDDATNEKDLNDEITSRFNFDSSSISSLISEWSEES